MLMKLGGKCEEEEKKCHTRKSAEGSRRSPLTPTKRKHSTETKELTEVRKKSKKKRPSEESDGSINAESNSGDSGSTIASPAFDGIARGRPLGDDPDTNENPSTPKNVRSR